MNPQEQTNLEPNEQQTHKETKGKYIVAIVVLAILAIGGFVFGGVVLLNRPRENDIVAQEAALSKDKNNEPKKEPYKISVDNDNELGKKLFEKAQSISATDGCGSTVYPLYEGGDVINFRSIDRDYLFTIIAKRIPEIANLKENGEKTEVSGDEMQKALKSIFSEYISIDDTIFGFHNSASDDDTQHTYLDDYEITKAKNEDYIVTLKIEPRPACERERFYDSYEYIGLSNTIDSQITNESEGNSQKVMIVLEKTTIDMMDEVDETKSTTDMAGEVDGAKSYYGVLFERRQDSDEYLWVGAYYLGNVIDR